MVELNWGLYDSEVLVLTFKSIPQWIEWTLKHSLCSILLNNNHMQAIQSF
jgi:hypothetical protein